MYSKEVINSAYNMIVRPHLEYASTCWNPCTNQGIDKLEAVQLRAARFVLNFYNYHPTADLTGNIQKSLQWDSLQHRRAVSDLCMFYEQRNNLANIAIPPILVPSAKHNCYYNHIQSLHSDAFRYQFLPEVSDFGISFLTIWQLSHLLSHFALQLSSGSHPYSCTSTQAQMPVAWFIILLSFCFFITFFLSFFLFLYLFNVLKTDDYDLFYVHFHEIN